MDELKAQWIATDAHHRGMVMMQLRKIAVRSYCIGRMQMAIRPWRWCDARRRGS